ncbi:YgjV family protein [Azospirillum argentinense]|nr:YgjV family protein [Azospirillum argentinense]
MISAADVTGVVAFALVALWPLAKGRQAMLVGQAASAAAFAVYYLLLGAHTGAAMTLLSLVQGFAMYPVKRSWTHKALFSATLPAMAVLVALTWHGWPSAFAVIGLLLATVGRWQATAAGLRRGFLGSGFAWIGHDIVTGSWYGLAADALCMVNLIVGSMRETRQMVKPGGPQRSPA